MTDIRPRVQDIFMPTDLKGGIFTYIKKQASPVPEYLNLSDQELLMLDFSFVQRQYDKRIGTLYDMFYSEGTADKEILLTYCATVSYSLYNTSWDYEYKALTAEYIPINNYDMTESLTSNKTNSGTTGDDRTITRDETETPNLTQNGKTTNDATGSLFGFNSTNSVPSDETASNTTTTTTQSGSVTTSGTESDTNTRTVNLSESVTHKLTRSGNIGVTTSQQMIESELELRKKQFYNIMITDIARVACLPIF